MYKTTKYDQKFVPNYLIYFIQINTKIIKITKSSSGWHILHKTSKYLTETILIYRWLYMCIKWRIWKKSHKLLKIRTNQNCLISSGWYFFNKFHKILYSKNTNLYMLLLIYVFIKRIEQHGHKLLNFLNSNTYPKCPDSI